MMLKIAHKGFALTCCLLLSIFLLTGQAPAQPPGLEAELCLQADMVSGQYAPLASLPAGAKGFLVALTSRHDKRLAVSAAWQAVNAPGMPSGANLAEDQALLSPGRTKFIPFQAGPGGLVPGGYRVKLVAEGVVLKELAFEVKPAEAAAAPPAATDKAAQEETSAQALERVFKTKQGPEAVKEGAAVMGSFFDKELGSSASSPKTPPAGPAKEAPVPAAPPAPAPTPAPGQAAPASALPAASQPAAPPAPAQAPPAASAPALPTGQGLPSQTAPGIKAVCVRRVDAQKAPLETTSRFDENEPKILLAFHSQDPTLKEIVKVRWLAVQVEGMPSGKQVRESSQVLRAGSWNTAPFLPPEGGFWPGRYRAEMAQEEKIIAQVDFVIASSQPAAALLSESPAPAGFNLAQRELGGKVVSATSQANSSSWAKENLIDGMGYGGKNCSPACGWASSSRKTPQELVFSFRDQGEALINGVIINCESCDGDESCLASLPRQVEVWVSSQGPEAGYKLSASRRLRPVAGQHFIALQPVKAKFVKLVIKSHYGSSRRVQLAEVAILEAPPGPSLTEGLEFDLALPSLGGALIRYSSEDYGREASRLILPQADGKGWRSADDKLPQEFVFGFRDDREAFIDRVELLPDLKADPGSRPKLVSVEASAISPSQGFVEITRQEFATQGGPLVVPVGKAARFLKLRILENQGGKYASLGRVRIVEGKAPGYVSLLAQPPRIDQAGFEPPQPDPTLVTSGVRPGDSPQDAPALELGKRVKAAFQEYGKKHYYSLELPGDRPGQLNLELMGQPFLRVKLTLLDKEGRPIAEFSPENNSPRRTMVSWRVNPGQYRIMVETTPANIILAYDVSGSMSGQTDLLREAVTGFIKRVRPSEKVNLIAFNNNVLVLLPGFVNDQAQLLEAVSGKFKAEMATRLFDAVAEGIKLLKEAKGAGVMVVMTDGVDEGSATKSPRFWEVMAGNPVRIFTLGLGGELKVNQRKTGISGQRLLSYVAQSTGGRYIPIPNVELMVEAYRKIAEELMSGTTYYLLPTWNFNPGLLMVEAQGEKIVRMTAPPRIELILDGSGSMKKKLGNRTRMEVAKEVLKDIIEQLPEGVEVGFRVYGHRIREGRKGDCQDTELIYRFDKLNKKKLIRQVEAVKALGTTPIAYSLKQVPGDFGEAPGEKTVILVTDGKEECGGDLVATMDELRAQGLDVKLHVVGFAVDDPQAHKQMREAAAAGKGRYISAMDSAGLKKAMQDTLALPFKVWDSKGEEVASGSAGKELGLPAGYYRVVFDTPQGELVKDEVEVAEDKTTLLKITKDGPKIGIQVLPPAAAR